MRHISLFLLSLLALPAAETPVAIWGSGPGTVAGEPASIQSAISTSQTITCGDQTVRLELIGFPGSDVIMRAGSIVRFTITEQQESHQLVVELERGAVQVDITGTGPWSGLTVRAGTVEAQVTGTLFVVERDEQEGDFVGLIRGSLQVKLRREIAAALGEQSAGLTDRQGISGTATGLGEVIAMTNRPQITSTKSMKDQATAPPDGDGGWDDDDAGTMTGDIPDGDIITVLPESFIDPGVGPIEPGTGPGPGPEDFAVIDAVLEDLPSSGVEKMGSPDVIGDVISTVGAGSPFGAPPGPP